MKISKKFWGLATLSLAILTACGSAAPVQKTPDAAVQTAIRVAEIKPYVFEEANFSINFPGKPEVKTEAVGEDSETTTKLNLTTYSFALDDNNLFIVGYTDAGPDKINVDDARKFLKGEKEGVLGSFGIKTADEEKQSDYDKYPGLMYRAKNADGLYLAAQTYVVGTKIYQIEMLSKTARPTDDQVKAFIGTFKLLK